MKRTVIFLALIMLFLSSCSVNTNKLFDINYEIYPSNNVSFVTDKEKYSSMDTRIRYTITNISNEENSIPADINDFHLEKMVNGEWKWVGFKKDYDIHYLARILYPGETAEREIRLDDYFYLPLEKGEYRISIAGFVSNKFEISG